MTIWLQPLIQFTVSKACSPKRCLRQIYIIACLFKLLLPGIANFSFIYYIVQIIYKRENTTMYSYYLVSYIGFIPQM